MPDFAPPEPIRGQITNLEEEANHKLFEARRMKMQFELDLREGYFFAAPHRARNVLSAVVTPVVKPKDYALLNTSFAFELCGDFPTVMINTFLPESQPWAKREAGPHIPKQFHDQVNKDAEAGDALIFDAIAASNFYAACGEAFNPDLSLGTVAMWINRDIAGMPIKCQPVPIRELEINTGPYGDLDERWVSRWTYNRHIPTLCQDIDLPKAILDLAKTESMAKTNISWGFWRDHSEDTETWQHVVLVKSKLVHQAKLTGRGSCPLIVARFNPALEWPWGIGPLMQALPDLRHHDALSEAKIKNLELNLQPPMAWPDDSWTNIEEGILPAMAYAVRPGSEGAIKAIYEPNPPDAAVYDKNDLEQRLRRLFFLDWPHQTGDTPPTATQWLDQMSMAQRRIGTPGLTFWNEFCGGCFTRFQYILEKEGVIKPIKVQGKSAVVLPYNPAQRAIEQQEVGEFTRFIQIAGGFAPEEFKLHTDGVATMMELARRLGVQDIWKIRSPKQIQAALQQIQALQAGRPPTAPAIPEGEAAPESLAGATPPPPSAVFQFRGKL